MKVMEDLKEVLEDQLKKIAKKGDISPTELDSVYKATKTLKYMNEIKQSEEGGSEGGMSNRGGSYARGYSTHMPMGGYGPIWNSAYPDSYDMSRDRGSYDRGNYNTSNRGSYDGNSNNRGSYDGSYDNMSNDGNSNRGSYDGSYEGSFRRGRDARGRYTSRDGSYDYSRASKEEMVSKIEQMMNEASSEKERNALRQCLEKLEG